MAFTTWVHSVASMSWIDPRTGLPEVDTKDPGPWTSRSHITSTLGYRFANFLEAFITVDDSTGYTVGHGFTPASGIYRGLSFAGFPSAFWLPIRSVRLGRDPVVFTQIVGAQTKSAEGIGEMFGGPIGGLIAHMAKSFPPIWTELELSMYSDGRFEEKILRYSLFPSMNAYKEDFHPTWQEPDHKDWYDPSYPNITRIFYDVCRKHDGMPSYEEWLKRGWGSIATAGTSGPTAGNPFNVDSSVIDIESWIPKGPSYNPG